MVSINTILPLEHRWLLDDHRIFHAWFSTLKKKGVPLKDRKTGQPLDEKEIAKRHEEVVKTLLDLGYTHNMIDSLDDTLSVSIKAKSKIKNSKKPKVIK